MCSAKSPCCWSVSLVLLLHMWRECVAVLLLLLPFLLHIVKNNKMFVGCIVGVTNIVGYLIIGTVTVNQEYLIYVAGGFNCLLGVTAILTR